MPTHEVERHLSTLQALPGIAAALAQRWRAERLAVESAWDVHGREKLEAIEEVRAEALTDVARLEWEHRKAAEGLTAELHKVRHSHRVFGIAEQMAWESLRGVLDGVAPGQPRSLRAEERLKRAQAEGDEPMLRVARKMLPDYLDGHGEELPEYLRDWLDITAGGAGVGEAVALERHATKKGIPWVGSAIGFVKHEVQGGTDSNPNVPTWTGEVVELGEIPDYGAARQAAITEAGAILARAGFRPREGGGVVRT